VRGSNSIAFHDVGQRHLAIAFLREKRPGYVIDPVEHTARVSQPFADAFRTQQRIVGTSVIARPVVGLRSGRQQLKTRARQAGQHAKQGFALLARARSQDVVAADHQ